MKMVLGVVWLEMAMHYSSKAGEPMFDEGLSMDNPRTILGLLKSPD